MKKILKITSYFLIMLIFCIAFSGCGSKTASSKKQLVVWSFEDQDAWKSVISSFEKKYGSYNIVYAQQTLDKNYENRVLNSILSGKGPDVWAMPNDWVYRHKDKLAAMPDELASEIDMDKEFVPSVKKSVYFDNKVYALTPSVEPLMIYYNTDLFSSTLDAIENNSTDKNYIKRAETLLENPPSLWSDLTEAANMLTIKNDSLITQSGLAMGTSSIINSQDILYLLMMQNDTSIFSDDLSQAKFNLPTDTSSGSINIPGQKALDFYTSFANPSSLNYTWSDSLGNSIDAFGQGKVAMMFGYSNLSNTLLQKYPNLKYRKTYIPQLSSDSEKITDYAIFNALGVTNNSNSAAGWTLVNLLISDYSDDFNSYAGLYTSKKSSNYDISITNRTGNNPERLELATAKSLVKGRYPSEFDSYIRDAISTVNNGTQTSLNALNLISDNITTLLRKTSW